MNENYTIGMALMDFVPNLAYLVGAWFLVKLILMERGKRCGRMFMAGALLVFLGGTLKATWKLIYAATGADLNLLSQQQFVLLAIGFTGALVAIILLAREGRGAGTAPLAAMAGWKIPFLAVMTLAQIGALGILTYISFRRLNHLAAFMFILTVLCTFGMSGMASAEQTVAIQWVEQSINALGQITFGIGSYLLYKQAKQKPEMARC